MKCMVVLSLCLAFCYGQHNNTEVSLLFQCMEHKDTTQSEKPHSLILKLCIRAADSESVELTCDMYESRYEITYAAGYCLNGNRDSRGILKEAKKFITKWEIFYVFITILKWDGKNTTKPDTILKQRIEPDSMETKYKLDPLNSEFSNTFQIELLINFTCSTNFFGEKCEKYCFNVSSHFQCTENGTRKCLNGYYGTDCNKIIKDECPTDPLCNCQNVNVNDTECTQLSTGCHKSINGCLDDSCVLDLVNLNINCSTTPTSPPKESAKEGLHMYVTMPVTVFGVIIIVLLLIIFFQGIYKRKEKSTCKGKHIARRTLPNLPRDISCYDDFTPPYAHYIDMHNQCPYSNLTVSESDTTDDCSTTYSPYA